jgi:hypothetical protein
MILEKVKMHNRKIIFFTINTLLVVGGISYIKQGSLEYAIGKSKLEIASQELNVLQASKIDAQTFDENIKNIKLQKLDSIANNPAVMTKKETVAVTKTIPGATRTVSSTSTPASAKTTTVKKSTSASAPAPAPAASTKTS